MRKLVLQIMKL